MRMDIDTIIIPWKNKKDLVEIPEEYRKKLTFIPVKSFDDVLDIALINWKNRFKSGKKKKVRGNRKDNIPPIAA